jgi:orotidine-5'-phosphate decarboxylase
MIDRLIEKIKSTDNPSVAGIDTSFDYLPENVKSKCFSLSDAAAAIVDFNAELIENLYKIVPAVKVQVAYYEMYGVEGMAAFKKTLEMAKERGLIVISDVKRNDIGSTATCYSNAYIGGVNVGGKRFTAFESDFITVNAYLGEDGIKPFVNGCKENDKGIFALVKTSNPSSGQLQDRVFESGETLYESVAALVEKWGEPLVGKYGYTDVGAVVGATHPKQAERLRKIMPHTFFLVPGYGAQGGTAEDLTVCFDEKGLGAIVNSSRGIICAYKNEKYRGLSVGKAAAAAAEDMREDINKALLNR